MTEDVVQDIIRRIVATAPPQKIILFGSRARGDARPGSDFDLLVIKESSEPGYRRDAPLYAALADLPVEVDVLVYTPEEVADWAQVPQAFVTTATREGKTIYERES
jgi:predicted nucleotidyltransferase